MSYLDELGHELGLVGIDRVRRERILAEAADHLSEGGVGMFGDAGDLARRFADELATAGSRRVALRAFGALAVAGLGFAAAWLLVPAAGGWSNIGSARVVPLAIVGGFGMVIWCQIAFATGLLALLQAMRLRRERVASAADVALLLRRTRMAIGFGAATMLSMSLYATTSDLAWWYAVSVGGGGIVLTLPLLLVANAAAPVARLRSSVAGEAGDVFDDLPVRLPRRPWALCLTLAALVAFVALGAAGADEGPRNAVAEAALVIACFAVLGRRLGLRR